MKDNKKIILTGGGTAGHVSLNEAIIPSLQEAGYSADRKKLRGNLWKNRNQYDMVGEQVIIFKL